MTSTSSRSRRSSGFFVLGGRACFTRMGEYSGNRVRWQPPHFNSRRSKRDECVNQDTIVSKPHNLKLVAQSMCLNNPVMSSGILFYVGPSMTLTDPFYKATPYLLSSLSRYKNFDLLSASFLLSLVHFVYLGPTTLLFVPLFSPHTLNPKP